MAHAEGATALKDIRLVPDGYNANWVWRRLQVYLLAIAVAAAAFLFWAGLKSGRLDMSFEALAGAGSAACLFVRPLREWVAQLLPKQIEWKIGGAAVTIAALGVASALLLAKNPPSFRLERNSPLATGAGQSNPS